MCGFFAQIPFKNHKSFSKKKFIESSELISHRGPDDKKFFFSKTINLSFYRLSIIDQSSKASQPMVSFSKNLIIVFNGEIYNAKKLRNKLVGYNFKSNSRNLSFNQEETLSLNVSKNSFHAQSQATSTQLYHFEHPRTSHVSCRLDHNGLELVLFYHLI